MEHMCLRSVYILHEKVWLNSKRLEIYIVFLSETTKKNTKRYNSKANRNIKLKNHLNYIFKWYERKGNSNTTVE